MRDNDERANRATTAAPTNNSLDRQFALSLLEHLLDSFPRALSAGGVGALPYFQTLHVLVLQNRSEPRLLRLVPRLVSILMNDQHSTSNNSDDNNNNNNNKDIDTPTNNDDVPLLFGDAFRGDSLPRTASLEVRVLCLKMLAALTALRPSDTSSRKPPSATAAATSSKLPTTSEAKDDATKSGAQSLVSHPRLASAVIKELRALNTSAQLLPMLTRIADRNLNFSLILFINIIFINIFFVFKYWMHVLVRWMPPANLFQQLKPFNLLPALVFFFCSFFTCPQFLSPFS